MARQRDPRRDESFEMWKASGSELDLVYIAEKLCLPPGTVRGWKAKDKWDEKLNGTLQSNERNAPKNAERSKREKHIQEDESETIQNKKEARHESLNITPKQRLFVQEYLIDLNATQAAIRAGYAPDSAHVQGPRLIGNDRVQLAIKEAQQAREKRTGITADRVVEQIAKIAFVDLRDIVTWKDGKIRVRPSDEIDGTVLAEISETISEGGAISKKVKINDRMRALDMLAKHTGLLDSHRRKLEESKEKRAAEKHALDMAKANVDQDTGDVVIVVDLEDDDDEG
jgi:phage terminase small subunit